MGSDFLATILLNIRILISFLVIIILKILGEHLDLATRKKITFFGKYLYTFNYKYKRRLKEVTFQ